jgi:hypothetical protein
VTSSFARASGFNGNTRQHVQRHFFRTLLGIALAKRGDSSRKEVQL